MIVPLLHLTRVTKFCGAINALRGLSFELWARAPSQPGGLPDISRGLSVSDTPGTPSKTNRTPEGCQNSSELPSRSQRLESFAPLLGASPLRRLSRGVASLRSARPPANVCEPSGFVSSCHVHGQVA